MRIARLFILFTIIASCAEAPLPPRGDIKVIINHPNYHEPVFYFIPYNRDIPEFTSPDDNGLFEENSEFRRSPGGITGSIDGVHKGMNRSIKWSDGKCVFRDGRFYCSLKVYKTAYELSFRPDEMYINTFDDGVKIRAEFNEYKFEQAGAANPLTPSAPEGD